MDLFGRLGRYLGTFTQVKKYCQNHQHLRISKGKSQDIPLFTIVDKRTPTIPYKTSHMA